MKYKNITTLFIGINIIYYILTSILYSFSLSGQEALNVGAFYPPYIYEYHEYYRLITSNFIHFDIFHIIFNLIAFYQLGTLVENYGRFSKIQYLSILIVSAISTSGIPYILYLLFHFGENTVSGGFSGVVFGVIGSIAALAYLDQSYFKRIFDSLKMNLIFMIIISLMPGISMSAHICGFIGGFITTYLIRSFSIHNSNIYYS